MLSLAAYYTLWTHVDRGLQGGHPSSWLMISRAPRLNSSILYQPVPARRVVGRYSPEEIYCVLSARVREGHPLGAVV
jgi:hypothetical protein